MSYHYIPTTSRTHCPVRPEIVQNATKSIPGAFMYGGAVVGGTVATRLGKDCQIGQDIGAFAFGVLGCVIQSKIKSRSEKPLRKVYEWQ
jgi:outer membrane lipoprotein SlyB